jgi:hypothetical protein
VLVADTVVGVLEVLNPPLTIAQRTEASGSLQGMTAYTLELPCPDAAGRGAFPRPPDDVPPDGSNI